MANEKPVVKAVFFDTEDKEISRLAPEVEYMVVTWEGEEPFYFRLSDFSDEIQRCFALMGLKTKISNTWASTKEKGYGHVREQFDAVVERLKAGEWVRQGETAVSTLLLAEAWHRALKAAGKPLADEPDALDRINAHIRGLDKEGRAELASNPEIDAAKKAIVAERAAARAKKAAKAAKGAEVELPTL